MHVFGVVGQSFSERLMAYLEHSLPSEVNALKPRYVSQLEGCPSWVPLIRPWTCQSSWAIHLIG